MLITIPPAEVEINESIVRSLIDSQFPQFRDLHISFLDSGWDNENYRLGLDYIVRLPRREAAIPLIHNEIKWLPKLKDSLSINIPAPIHIGKSSKLYPWLWTIIPWSDGQNACFAHPDDSEVIRLVDFLKYLHLHQPTDAPYNDHRCLALSDKSAEVIKRIKGLKTKDGLDMDHLLDLWNISVKEPGPSENALLHGDMHPRNIIINDGKINAIIDWGDITSGDVALDLASIWILFDDHNVRVKGFGHYGADHSMIIRSRGWAIFFGTLFLELGTSASAEYRAAGERILKNVMSPKV